MRRDKHGNDMFPRTHRLTWHLNLYAVIMAAFAVICFWSCLSDM